MLAKNGKFGDGNAHLLVTNGSFVVKMDLAVIDLKVSSKIGNFSIKNGNCIGKMEFRALEIKIGI